MLHLSDRRPLIAAHRGVSSGNVPPNSAPAFLAALAQHADIIELDVTQSADGELFVFHPGMERPHLGLEGCIGHMESWDVRRLRFINQDGTPTAHGLLTLREALTMLRDRCVVNIDKFEIYPAPIARLVQEMGMQDQVLVKTSAREECFRTMEEVAPDIPYLAIIRETDEVTDMLLRRPLRYAGTEVLFQGEDSPLASAAYVHGMREKGLLTWVNAIVYDYRQVLCAGHDDDRSVSGDPDGGWGWLMDRGYDVIQTDWPLALHLYRQQRA